MKTPFQQFNQQVLQRQREGGYYWTKAKQRQAELENQELPQYPQRRSGGVANIIWILAVGCIIYYVFFTH